MAEDPESEFERIFGKAQKESELRSPGAAQKLPSDSDVLGIRTDSDRFLVKNLPENIPAKSATPAADPKSSEDAMTIALNVNVFANIADAKKVANPSVGTGKDKPAEALAADGATFVIPSKKEGPRIPAAAGEEFTRVMHLQDAVKVPKPSSAKDESNAAATIAISGPKAAAAPAPTAAPMPAAPIPPPPMVTAPGMSEFTKVIKGSEVRSLQEKFANSPPPPAVPNAWPQASAPWTPTTQAPVPGYVPSPQAPWPGNQPKMPVPQQSKLSEYMPLILAVTVLFFLAVLLVVFFALKK